MAHILAAFGIDWRLLLIDTINFGIVLFVMWYFLYGPLTKMLDKRRDLIAQGVKDAEGAKKELAAIEASRTEVMAKAGKEADEIVSRARNSGVQVQRELSEKGEQAASAMLREAEAQAKELKTQALQESKEETAKLIVLGIEKAMQK